MTDTETIAAGDDLISGVVGQPLAVEQLRAGLAKTVHAYMFVGPRGAGRRHAAMAFAGELLAQDAPTPEAAQRIRDLARREELPDLFIHRPGGPVFTVDDAEALILEGTRSPIEGRRKVVIAERFHTGNDQSAVKLLKVIEEPPPTVVFILLSEFVPPEHIAIASRCATVEFSQVAAEAIEARLIADGLAADVAATVASASGGSLDRARLLATDDRFVARRDAWAGVPARLDGTGAAVALLVSELQELIAEAAEPLAARHGEELEALAEREENLGTRGSGRKALEARHKREMRLQRYDEYRLGLATLAAHYRADLDTAPDAAHRISALRRITEVAEALERNPNETLLFQSLFLDL